MGIENKTNKNNQENNKIMQSFSLFGELFYEIAIPVVTLTLLGKYLDKLWNHNFLFVLIGGIVGIVLAVLAVYLKAKKIRNKIYSKNKEDNKKD